MHLNQSPVRSAGEVGVLENLQYGIKIFKYGTKILKYTIKILKWNIKILQYSTKILQDSIKGRLNEHFSRYALTQGYLGRSVTFKAQPYFP